jgi:hypothetical protein
MNSTRKPEAEPELTEVGALSAAGYSLAMDTLMRFPSARKRDATIEAWLSGPPDELSDLVRPWYAKMRACGDDVRELMHDGYPTACVHDAAFAYVGIFRAHANVGFFYGAELRDPARLLEGTGKRMRHVKLRPGHTVDAAALDDLIQAACVHIRGLLKRSERPPSPPRTK